MFLYEVLEDNLYLEDVGYYTTFGVRVYDDTLHKTIMSIKDVFPKDREKAMRFVETCNSLQLEPVHLLDVIEDIL